LKGSISDCEDLIDEQDVGIEMGGDGESETNKHAARVALDRRIDKSFDLGECDDLIELASDFVTVHTKDRAVEKDIFSTGELRVETDPDLQQTSDLAAHKHPPSTWLCDTRQDLQQGRFAGSVGTDDAEALALVNAKGEMPKGPYEPLLQTGGLGLFDVESTKVSKVSRPLFEP
jgi:hypothetical protein